MADVLQGFQLLGRFSLIFPFLFVLVLIYAVLAKTKILGENGIVQGVVALAVAILFMFSKKAVTVISLMAPWFVILFVFIIFTILAFMLFGVKEADFVSLVKDSAYSTTVVYWIIALILIIVLGSISSVSFTGAEEGTVIQEGGDVGMAGEVTEKGSGAFWATLFHPKVLGLIMILLIAMFTLQRLANVAV